MELIDFENMIEEIVADAAIKETIEKLIQPTDMNKIIEIIVKIVGGEVMRKLMEIGKEVNLFE